MLFENLLQLFLEPNKGPLSVRFWCLLKFHRICFIKSLCQYYSGETSSTEFLGRHSPFETNIAENNLKRDEITIAHGQKSVYRINVVCNQNNLHKQLCCENNIKSAFRTFKRATTGILTIQKNSPMIGTQYPWPMGVLLGAIHILRKQGISPYPPTHPPT